LEGVIKLHSRFKSFLFRELPIPLFAAIFSIVYLFSTNEYSFVVIRYPYAVIAVIAILIVLIMGDLIKKLKKPRESYSKTDTGLEFNLNYMIMILVLSFLYLILITWLGYFSSTALFLISLMVLLKVRRALLLIGIPLFYITLSYLIFRVFLRLPLPEGFLI
jgi:hypothetical protein